MTLGASFHCSSFSATRRPLVTRCEGGVQKWKTEYDFVEGKKRFQLCFVGTHPVKERDAVRSIQAHLGTTGQLNRRPGPLAIPLRTSEITGGRVSPVYKEHARWQTNVRHRTLVPSLAPHTRRAIIYLLAIDFQL